MNAKDRAAWGNYYWKVHEEENCNFLELMFWGDNRPKENGTFYTVQIKENKKARWKDWKVGCLIFHPSIPHRFVKGLRRALSNHPSALFAKSEEEVFNAMLDASDPKYKNLPPNARNAEFRITKFTNKVSVTSSHGKPIPYKKIKTVCKFKSFNRKGN